jgi:hypothetical protein
MGQDDFTRELEAGAALSTNEAIAYTQIPNRSPTQQLALLEHAPLQVGPMVVSREGAGFRGRTSGDESVADT